jgi:nucleoside-diphosphate-sugar epimerase
MKVLVLGASGATGRLVLQQLLNRKTETKIVVRGIEKVSKEILNNKLLECIVGNISEFTPGKYSDLISDCDAVISCLGHNITFSGIFGKPRLLVTECIRSISEAIERSKKDKVKIILMSTTANRNRKVRENYTLGDKIVLSLLYVFLPPHKDNIKAAKYLSDKTAQNNSKIDWVSVRPDGLIDEEKESSYEVFASPQRSPVFNPGKTSRINVSHFMSELLFNEESWEKWKYKMPVVYNSSKS